MNRLRQRRAALRWIPWGVLRAPVHRLAGCILVLMGLGACFDPGVRSWVESGGCISVLLFTLHVSSFFLVMTISVSLSEVAPIV